MKKIISLCLGLILVLSCMVLPVSAWTPSPQADDIIISATAVQSDKKEAYISFAKLPKTDEDLNPTGKDDILIAQRALEIGAATYPLSFTVKMVGVNTSANYYVLAKNSGTAERIEAKATSNGVLEFKLDKAYTSIAFIKTPIIKPVENTTTGAVEIKKEEIKEAIDNTPKGETVVVEIEVAAPVEIPTESVEKIIKEEKTLTIESNIATAEFDAKALETITAAADKADTLVIRLVEAVTEELTEKEQSTIKKLEPELILTAEVLINNAKVSDFKGGKVNIAIDFTPKAGKTLADYFVVHIKDHGVTEKVKTFVENGELHIEVAHFSEYAVVEKATYDKVADEINKTETTSPATGSNAVNFLMIAALAVVFGTISFKKLSKAN